MLIDSPVEWSSEKENNKLFDKCMLLPSILGATVPKDSLLNFIEEIPVGR